jgi:primosomal replication protein N
LGFVALPVSPHQPQSWCNHIELQARVIELLPLRSTPAGLPVIEMWLEHQSDQSDGGFARRVALRIKAKALGVWAETFAHQPIGAVWRFQGFMASPGNTRQVVLHVQSAQAVVQPDVTVAAPMPEPVFKN